MHSTTMNSHQKNVPSGTSISDQATSDAWDGMCVNYGYEGHCCANGSQALLILLIRVNFH